MSNRSYCRCVCTSLLRKHKKHNKAPKSKSLKPLCALNNHHTWPQRGEEDSLKFKASIRMTKLKRLCTCACCRFTNWSSAGIFLGHNHLLGLQRMAPKTRKYPASSSECGGKCPVDARGQRSEWADWLETKARQQQTNTHWLQPRSTGWGLWMHNTGNLEAVYTLTGHCWVPSTSKVYLTKRPVSGDYGLVSIITVKVFCSTSQTCMKNYCLAEFKFKVH